LDAEFETIVGIEGGLRQGCSKVGYLAKSIPAHCLGT